MKPAARIALELQKDQGATFYYQSLDHARKQDLLEWIAEAPDAGARPEGAAEGGRGVGRLGDQASCAGRNTLKMVPPSGRESISIQPS